MRKKITAAVLTVAAIAGFAANEPISVQPVIPGESISLTQVEGKPALSLIREKVGQRRSFGYVRMGVSDSQLSTKDAYILPGLGVGYRIVSGVSAIDLSAAFSRRDFRLGKTKEETYVYTFPKANYLYYTAPLLKETSFYAGGGAAWSSLKTNDGREFLGLVANLALGLELNRNAAWRTFFQLDVSQPAIAASQQGAFPRPFAEFSLGTGF